MENQVQLASLLDFAKPDAVLAEAERLFTAAGTQEAFHTVAQAFDLAWKLFEGGYPAYRNCNTEYHDLCHTLQVFTAASRLLEGASLTGKAILPERRADVLLAALLHDVGYIQHIDEVEGTGAKFTQVHVARSMSFVREQSRVFHFSAERAERIAAIIQGTDLGQKWNDIPWKDEKERFGASLLAAADLLGQMSDRAYLEKLLFLYYEFREAGIPGYDTAFDILKKTAGFYRSIEARLDGPLGGASSYARAYFERHVGLDLDLYRQAISRQMEYLDRIIADNQGNFRNKLKRMDLEKIDQRHKIA